MRSVVFVLMWVGACGSQPAIVKPDPAPSTGSALKQPVATLFGAVVERAYKRQNRFELSEETVYGWRIKLPCTGPTLGVVLGLAGDPNTATAGRGALLTAVYCMGLGLPFVLAGLAFRKALGAFDVVKRHYAVVVRGGGLLLVAVGVLLVTGEWNTISLQLRNAFPGFATAV